MLTRLFIKYALEKVLEIDEWEKWTDSPFAFNGIPKDHRDIAQIVIYHDYKEVWIYTKEKGHSSMFTELDKLGLYTVYPASHKFEEDDKFRVSTINSNGLLIKFY